MYFVKTNNAFYAWPAFYHAQKCSIHHGDYTRVLWHEHLMSRRQFPCIHYHRPTILNVTWAVFLWPLSISLLYCLDFLVSLFFLMKFWLPLKKFLNVRLVFHS